MRVLIGLVVVLCSGAVLGQEPMRSQAELAKLPPYQRMLKSDDAKEASELGKSAAAAAVDNVDEAIKLQERVIDLRTRAQGADHWEVVSERLNLNTLRTLDAEGRRQWQMANRTDDEAIQQYAKSRYTEAQVLFQKALDIRRRVLGEDHPDTAASYNNLASNLDAQGKAGEAQPLYQNTLDIYRHVFGENHPDTATGYNNIAFNLNAQGKSAEAQSLYQKALDIRRRVLGEDNPDTAMGYNNLAMCLNTQGKTAEAEPLCRKSLDIYRRVLGEDDAYTATSYNNLAFNLDFQDKTAEAQPLFQKVLDSRRRTLGESHAHTAESYNNLAFNLQLQEKSSEALPLFEKALKIYRQVLGVQHPQTARSYHNLACSLEAQNRTAEAQPLYRKALDIFRQVLGEAHPQTAISYKHVAYNLQAQGKLAEAVPYLRQAVFSFEASRQNRAKGIERAIGEGFNPRLVLAALQQAQSPGEALGQVELSLSRGLLDQQGRMNALLSEREVAELATSQVGLKALQTQILYLVGKATRTEDENARLEGLLKERREMSQKLDLLAVAASTRAVASREQIQVAIPAQSALLLWVDVNDNSGKVQEHFACALLRDGDPFWVRLSGQGEHGKWTKDDSQLPDIVRARLSSTEPPNNLPKLIQQLRKQRIEPVLAHLKQHNITQLYVIGVNEMAGIPVEVIAPEFALSYVPSGTFLARLPKKPDFENTLLAVGDPIYEAKNANRIELTALPSHGLLIQSPAPGGAAEKLGVRSGDVLLSYGDTKIETLDQLRPAIQKASEASQQTMAVRVWRLGEDNKPEEKTLQFPVGPLGVILAQDPAPLAIASHRKDEAMFASLRGGDSWRDLPGTRFEVQRIGQLFGSSRVLLDGNANEKGIDAFRQADELKKFRFLHFATHGKGNNVTAFESKLVLSQDQHEEEPRAGEPWYNNEISAREVLDHWKLNADLVTLSACETGLGKSGSGDGLLGFAQAFLLTGARSVCLSLWEVDDTATALLMQRFYQNLLGKRTGLKEPMTKALALKEAKEWLRNLTNKEATEHAAALMNGISRGSRGETKIMNRIKADAPPDEKPFDHPHFWSAFILIGEPE